MLPKPCPYRQQRPVADALDGEFVCVAGDNHRLGTTGSDLANLEQICRECPIPGILTEEAKPCLHLIPIRIFAEAEVQTLYHCRIFYHINPERADGSPAWMLVTPKPPKPTVWWKRLLCRFVQR